MQPYIIQTGLALILGSDKIDKKGSASSLSLSVALNSTPVSQLGGTLPTPLTRPWPDPQSGTGREVDVFFF